MFNSASDILPPPPPKALGKDPSTLATDEHGRPVPYLAGRARLGLTWISEPWGVRSVPGPQEGRQEAADGRLQLLRQLCRDALRRPGPDLARHHRG
ncbi:MAG: hypothetical protein M5U12_13015 [Verrucomicrobia bacterium]|nr:hypothetical protein [Verrucomicrobiota bacterium]